MGNSPYRIVLNVCRKALGLFVVGAFLVACGAHPSDHGGTFVPAKTASPSPTSSCQLKVLESGFSMDSFGQIRYGLVVKNPCKKVAVDDPISVTALDSSGHAVGGATPPLPALASGQQTGLAGYMERHGGSQVATLSFEYEADNWISTDAFKKQYGDWSKPVVTNIRVGSSRTSRGNIAVSFDLRSTPENGLLEGPIAYIILKDTQGKIVSGEFMDAGSYENGTLRTGVWVPASVRTPQAGVYVLQGWSV